ncbi:MAG: LysR family transcriptional regulator [Acidaminococcus fermentans]|uniref:LysR family transcriptional regulator n=1 Tax=Acidaminococcus fermentans TaxID=905 RepID=UPI002430AB73|nr:LysR family transcriptional regulator [Acidaminococcus fermentans]MCF0140328.1 LysR family transcriptional regulator [Acidaminococcus fermentans]
MDTRLIEHILKIAEEKSITKAAEKLYLTQSALNQQLLHLEHELGTPLFKRSKTNWGPTRAGEIYLEGAREMLRVKQNTYSQISDLTHGYTGTIRVGMTPVRGPDMFIHVYPAFHEQYPNLVVVPYELNVFQMQKLVTAGDLDLGFMTLFESQRDDNEYQNLYEEEILIAVPEAWNLEGAVMEAGKRRPRLPLLALKDRPMILLRKQTTMRPVLDRLFRARQVVPQILFDTANPATILEMVRAGICCGIVAESTAQGFEQGIRYYSFEKPLRWNVAVSYPKGAFLNQAEKLFIQQAREYWMQKAKVQSAEKK